ncbi:MAG: DNA polymerase [bacterium]|nr:DNA polymerase [bacterium]MDZ4284677.1 DNA polymerase [Patescibacteria group bacterium]
MATATKKRLVLLDAHAIIHRAYHALPADFTSSRTGEPTGALYGLTTMLMRIIGEFKPDYIAGCFDLPQPTYRHEVFEGYKAGRPKADDALVAQLKRSRDLVRAFGIPVFEQPGFEADDLLGTIVELLNDRRDVEIIIASGDMDTLQLVSGTRVKVYTLKKGIRETALYDEEAVKQRFGFVPKFLPDYKGLAGDPSDNIPGVPGIGAKTASILVQNFGTIESLHKTLARFPEKLAEAGVSARVQRILSEHKDEALFSKALAEINRAAPITFNLAESDWRARADATVALELIGELDFRSLIGRVRELFGRPAGGAGSTAHEEGDGDTAPEEATESAPDSTALTEALIALWVLDSNITNPSLDDIFHFAGTHSFNEAREVLKREITARGFTRVFAEIERPLIPIVRAMEERGVKIDSAHLGALSRDYHRELEVLQKYIWKDAGREFNINSPKQLGEVIFDELKLVPRNHKKTAGGARSTRESELGKLRGAHPIIENIFAHRELQKLLSTYIDPIPTLLDSAGRLHARFLQTGTTTGRMASEKPNLQNIPIRTERGASIRRAFIAEQGFVLAAFDYSQIELRVAAILSGDPKLTEIFKRGEDIHTAVASEVFDVPPEKVDREMRRRAKVINFGILYGMGVNALRENLGTDRAEAERFMREYFETYTGLRDFLERTKAEAHRRGYTETLFGRRRSFEGIRSPIAHIRAMAERMALNAPIQGTSADLIKLAMIRVDEHVKREGLRGDAFLILQVHDELVYEVCEPRAADFVPEIKRIMEDVLSLEEARGVPLVTSSAVGKNWGEMNEFPISPGRF